VQALILTWVINFLFLLLSIIHVRGWFQIWTLLYSLVFMNISWEIERLMRVFFVQNKLMLEADRICSNRIYNEDMAVVNEVHQNKMLKASNEKQLVEYEKTQLRSLVNFVCLLDF
jgi:hypothetical protein